VFALTCNLVFLKIGAHVVLVANPRDLPDFIHTLKKTPMTAMIGVNTLYRALLDAPGFADVDLHRLKLAVGRRHGRAARGGAALEGGDRRAADRRLRPHRDLAGGDRQPLDIEDWSGNIGMPLPEHRGRRARRRRPRTAAGRGGRDLRARPAGHAGLLEPPRRDRRGLHRRRLAAHRRHGLMDERGCLRITDRKKDMIIVSGFKVFPNEVEDVVGDAPRRARVGRRRRARREDRRGRQAGAGAQGPGADERRPDRALPRST
jgi:long-chain acyl-CoA synthetase